MTNQKGFVLPILITVSLLILAVVAYFFSPKSITSKLPTSSPATSIDPTANWKIYTDPQYGFTFKYPDTIFFKNDSINFLVAYPEDKKRENDFEINYRDFYIDSSFVQQNMSFDAAISKAKEYFKPSSDYKIEYMKNGFVKMSGYSNGKNNTRAFYNYSGKAIELNYWQGYWTVTPETFDQILSTFKFTK